jgi:hypothetical protein
MRRGDVGIFDILGVQGFKLPICVFLLLFVLEVGDFTEHGDFLDKIL